VTASALRHVTCRHDARPRFHPRAAATLFLGLLALLVGVGVLIAPMYRGDVECGSAILPNKRKVAPQTYAVPKQCESPLHLNRWLGGAIVAVGTVAVLGTGTRCLVTPD
jgi:hypothetical protein